MLDDRGEETNESVFLDEIGPRQFHGFSGDSRLEFPLPLERGVLVGLEDRAEFLPGDVGKVFVLGAQRLK